MTKFKKCDYCGTIIKVGKDGWKIKGVRKFGEGKRKIPEHKSNIGGGGYVRETSPVIFLCDNCYNDFTKSNEESSNEESEENTNTMSFFEDIPKMPKKLDDIIQKKNIKKLTGVFVKNDP